MGHLVSGSPFAWLEDVEKDDLWSCCWYFRFLSGLRCQPQSLPHRKVSPQLHSKANSPSQGAFQGEAGVWNPQATQPTLSCPPFITIALNYQMMMMMIRMKHWNSVNLLKTPLLQHTKVYSPSVKAGIFLVNRFCIIFNISSTSACSVMSFFFSSEMHPIMQKIPSIQDSIWVHGSSGL